MSKSRIAMHCRNLGIRVIEIKDLRVIIPTTGFGRLFAFVINLRFFSVNLDASGFSAS